MLRDPSTFLRLRPDLLSVMQAGETTIQAAMGGQVRRFAAGEVITAAEALDARIYLLRSGWLRRVRALPDGRAQTMLIFLPGDIVGAKSLLMTRAPDEITALSDGDALTIAPTALRQLADTRPEVMYRLMGQLAEDERRLHDLAVALGQGSAEERVSLAIHDLLVRLRRSRMLADTAAGFALPMTQQQLAEYCGLTAIHINRVLRRLRLDGVVEMRRGLVRVLDEAALELRALPLLQREVRDQAAE